MGSHIATRTSRKGGGWDSHVGIYMHKKFGGAFDMLIVTIGKMITFMVVDMGWISLDGGLTKRKPVSNSHCGIQQSLMNQNCAIQLPKSTWDEECGKSGWVKLGEKI